MRVLKTVLAAGALALAAAAPASAGIWTPIDSGTTDTITTADYQGGDNLWYATSSGKIFKKGVQKAAFAGVTFNDIAFRPGGDIGIAVAQGGKLFRSTDGGNTWTAGPALTTKQPCGNTTPATPTLSDDLLAVAWASPTRAYVVGAGGGEIQRTDDTGTSFTEIGRLGGATGACHIDAEITDVAPVFNSDTVAFVAKSFGNFYLSSDALASDAVKKDSSVNNFTGRPRIANDPQSTNRYFSADRDDGTLSFQFSEDSGNNFETQTVSPSSAQIPILQDVSAGPGVGIAVGNAGGIFTSLDGKTTYYQPADGTFATKDWKAVDVASATNAVVAGVGGAMVVTTRANTIPDLVAPAGTITAPGSVSVGKPATFTANLADNAGGSGIDPASIVWTSPGLPNASGNPVQLTFPSTGTFQVTVAFKDLAGNVGSATATVTVGKAATVVVTGPSKTATATVPGATLSLKGVPKACVPAGAAFNTTLSSKRKVKKNNRFQKVTKVGFRLDGNTIVIDRKAPFKQLIKIGGLTPKSKHTLTVKAFIKNKGSKKTPTKVVRSTFTVCG